MNGWIITEWIKTTNEAKDAKADIIGGDELVEKIKNGELNFEKLICTPSMMIKLSKLGKVLGPKGLMPSPKSGTVTENIDKAVKEIKHGQVRFKAEQEGIVQGTIANVSMKKAQLKENFDSFIKNFLENKKSPHKEILKQTRLALQNKEMACLYGCLNFINKLNKNIEKS